VTTFRSMGCEVVLADDVPVAAIRALFDARDRRFSRFLPSSEISRVNAMPRGLTPVSEEFASMLTLALDAARASGGLVTPTVGAALLNAGYDRDFDALPTSQAAVEPVGVPSPTAVRLFGHVLLRHEEVTLDLNGVVKGKTVDDALALAGRGWISAGGDVATNVHLVVGLPGGDSVTLDRGGLATSSIAKRAWRGGHHLIDPATGLPSQTPWRDVTVAAQRCIIADVAAKAALLLGEAGPSWLDRRSLPGRFVDRSGGVRVNETWRQLTFAPIAA
jgi:FAD:protein FMN transferase